MIQSIATVAIYVSDQEQALAFWTTQVGFELRLRHPLGPTGEWIEVAPAGAQTRLVLYPRSLMANWAERKPSILFACSDLNAVHARLVAHQVHVVAPPRTMPWGTFATFADPDGNEFILKE